MKIRLAVAKVKDRVAVDCGEGVGSGCIKWMYKGAMWGLFVVRELF